MQYDVGDTVLLEHTVRVDGDLTDATVTLALTSPAGTVSSPAVTHVSTGYYRAAVPATLTGPWAFSWDVSGPVDDVVPGQFSVGDPAPPAYASLDDLKEMRRIKTNTEDAALLRRLNVASRRIDRKCHRRFWLDPAPVVREFNTAGRFTPNGLLLVDDIGDAADLELATGTPGSWTTVEATAYTAFPDNALLAGQPITALEWLTSWYGRVQITARWGWPYVPDEITEATLLLANRLYLRKDSPEGVLGGELGGLRVSRWDPDVEALVQPFVLPNPP